MPASPCKLLACAAWRAVNLRRSPPPTNLDTRCQIHRRTPLPRPNWRSQTKFLCPVKGGFGPQKERFYDFPSSAADCTRRACPVRASDVRKKVHLPAQAPDWPESAVTPGWSVLTSHLINLRADYPWENPVLRQPGRAIRSPAMHTNGPECPVSFLALF